MGSDAVLSVRGADRQGRAGDAAGAPHERVAAAPDALVLRATKLRTGSACALKCIFCPALAARGAASPQAPRTYPKEAYIAFVEPFILSHVLHEAVVPLLGTVACPNGLTDSTAPPLVERTAPATTASLPQKQHQQRRWFPSSSTFYAIELPWFARDLQNAAATGRVGASDAAAIATQLFSALAYLHRRGVVHRAVAPWNIRLAGACSVVLAGFSAACTPDGDAAFVPPLPAVPASHWAPEQHAPGTAPHSAAEWARCDVWAAACVVAELLVGTRGCPLFCPRLLRAMVLGHDHLTQLLERRPGLRARYPITACLRAAQAAEASAPAVAAAAARAPAAAEQQSRRALEAPVVVDEEALCQLVGCRTGGSEQALEVARVVVRALAVEPRARPSAEAVVEQLAGLGGAALARQPWCADSKHKGRSVPEWTPISFVALHRFAVRHCGFLFK